MRPRVERLARSDLTARRAGVVIALITLVVTVAGGLLVTVVDREDFPTIGRGLWWALQTVTTVGYGDVTPKTDAGRVIGAIVMLTGIGFVTVVTATVTAIFVESARRRLDRDRPDPVLDRLSTIEDRLERIERRLDP